MRVTALLVLNTNAEKAHAVSYQNFSAYGRPHRGAPKPSGLTHDPPKHRVAGVCGKETINKDHSPRGYGG